MGSFKLLKGYSNSIQVNAGVRTIRAQWTPEMVEDINAYHGINIEDELTALLSEEIARTIDREIVQNLTFPMVRRVAAQTLGQELVNVQPLNAPVGILNYLDFEHNFGGYNFKHFKLLKG